MTIYKGCPYCTAVFAIGPEDDEPLRRHIAYAHATTPDLVVVAEGDPPGDDDTADALRVRLGAGDRRTRDLTLALLARQGVTVETLAEWFGLLPGTVRDRLDAVDRAMAARRPRVGERRRHERVEELDDGREQHRQREPTAEQ